MILRSLLFIQTFLKHCKALSTEKYKRYIDILLLILFYYLLLSLAAHSCFFFGKKAKTRNLNNVRDVFIEN